ncbi:hypothetical protein ACFY1P_33275 [Streptomyces sp. NPDC001407]|uniref:hypothetical protein n=1 Tax=Streptomyces sp. NPDC001407 TaxID=3364573 RepID=UPI0036CEB5B6
MGNTAWDRKTKRVIEIPGDEAGLDSGFACGYYDSSGIRRGRYMCRACFQDLILRALTPDARQKPNFRHKNRHGDSAECRASAERQQEIAADDQVVIELRDQIILALPGLTVTLELPEDPDSRGTDPAPPSWMPPAIIVSAAEGPVVIERPRRLPEPEDVQRRLRAVRARYGARARHVWFLAKDPLQFAQCGRLEVKPRGHERTVHVTIAPTAQQQTIVAVGGGVYWLDGQQVLVPYGVHDFTHQPRQGEDWDFCDWRRKKQWHQDWSISQPVPDAGATRWGLVPASLHQLTRAKAAFTLAEPRDIMQRLEDVQRARWRTRRADARELYTARRTSAPAAAVETLDAGQPIPPALPEQQDAVPEPPTAPGRTDGQVPSEPSDQSAVASPAPPNRTESASTPELAPSPPVPPSAPPSAPPAARPTAPQPSAVPAPPPYPPTTPPAPLPEQRPRGLRGMLRRLLGGQ